MIVQIEGESRQTEELVHFVVEATENWQVHTQGDREDVRTQESDVE